MINLSYKFNPNVTISSFAYLVDNKTAAEFSSNTLGLHLEGAAKPDQLKYNYSAEIAWQKDATNNPKNYQAWYLLAELGVQYRTD